MKHRFKAGDVVQTNYKGIRGHASGWSNGVVFTLTHMYAHSEGLPAWWDPSHKYYWLEEWLLPASIERQKTGFGKFIGRIESGDK